MSDTGDNDTRKAAMAGIETRARRGAAHAPERPDAAGDDLDALQNDLRADGLRITRQRLAILCALREADDHPSAEEVLTRARARDAAVSQATVYRTLAALEKSGAVLRNDFDGAGARYELAGRAHHDHLIDLDTGAVIEFRSDRIERLQEEIAAELGYDIAWHRLELYGRKRG